jgi:hypothetical protein
VAGGALYTGLHLSVFLSFAFDAQAEDNRRREYEYEQEGHLRHYQKLARFNLKQVTRSSSNLNFTSSNTSTCSVPVKRHRGRTGEVLSPSAALNTCRGGKSNTCI